MLKEERLQKLLAILEERGFATVEELSGHLGVSMPTIRRDLTTLAGQGLIARCHGGATPMADEKVTLPVDFRRSVNTKEKAKIAQAAADFIRSSMVIFIDASTTAAHIADHLKGFSDLIVITNSLVTAVFIRNLGIKTYCLGGEVISSSVAVGGSLAVETASNFNIDLMLFSSYGINELGMIVDTSEAETELRRYVLKRAETSIFLCDKSKFGKKSVYNFASLADVDYMITNGQLPRNYPLVRRETLILD